MANYRRALMDQLGTDEELLEPAPVSAPPIVAPSIMPGSTATLIGSASRRGGTAGGGGWGGAGKGAATGATVGAQFGGPIGAGVGALGGAIAGAFGKTAETAPTDFMLNDARSILGNAYREYLGRDASNDELLSQLRGQGWQTGDRYVGEQGLASVVNSLINSEEAKKHKSQPQSAPSTTVESAPVTSGAYRDRMSGVDFGKFDNPEHTTPKYQIARVLANYNPEEGITDAVLADLNKLGIGTFATNKPGGDYLRVSGNVDPRFEGVRGSDMAIDSGKGGWTGWGGNNAEDESGNPIDGPSKKGSFLQSAPTGFSLGAQLQGDPMARIQAALAQLSKKGSGNPNIDALIAQLGV